MCMPNSKRLLLTIEEGQELDATVKEYNDSNYNKTYIPLFKIYQTSASHGNGKNRAVTDTIGVKSTIAHAALLKEILVQITKNHTDNKPVLKFIPTGLVSTISGEAYVVLICKNNQFLTLAATIPVVRFTAEMLNLEIDAYHLLTKSRPPRNLFETYSLTLHGATPLNPCIM